MFMKFFLNKSGPHDLKCIESTLSFFQTSSFGDGLWNIPQLVNKNVNILQLIH